MGVIGEGRGRIARATDHLKTAKESISAFGTVCQNYASYLLGVMAAHVSLSGEALTDLQSDVKRAFVAQVKVLLGKQYTNAVKSNLSTTASIILHPSTTTFFHQTCPP